MSATLILVFVMAAAARIASVMVSKRHERDLRAAGAVEYGAVNTRIIALVHTLFYIAAFAEGWRRDTTFDGLSMAGLCVLTLAFLMLVWIIRLLGPIWTVKIMIAKDHPISRHPLFLHVRHPNYFLNIIPELVGYGVVFHAWWTLCVGLPIYLVVLAIRIRQEEEAMRPLFSSAA